MLLLLRYFTTWILLFSLFTKEKIFFFMLCYLIIYSTKIFSNKHLYEKIKNDYGINYKITFLLHVILHYLIPLFIIKKQNYKDKIITIKSLLFFIFFILFYLYFIDIYELYLIDKKMIIYDSIKIIMMIIIISKILKRN